MAAYSHAPIGSVLARTAKAVSRAFDDALVDAGGSRPMWLILLTLRTRQVNNQRELAAAVDIQGATLSHHLDGMEAAGLLTRRRDPENRRMHVVELTADGHAKFLQLRGAAMAHDTRLRADISDRDTATAIKVLNRMSANVYHGDAVG